MSRSLRSPEHLALCELCISARKSAGLTQAEVAARLKRPQSFVAKYEGGERRLDVIEFIEVVRVMGGEPGDVFEQLARSGGSSRRARNKGTRGGPFVSPSLASGQHLRPHVGS
jgi:transcriptional regulator with XRE-family HTH domain